MSATKIFPCGHSYSMGNIRSVTNLRCSICARDAMAARAMANNPKIPKQEAMRSNMAAYEGRIHEPLLGSDPSMESLPAACEALHKALYREHPGVFVQAIADGRYCVIPGSRW